MWLNLTQMNNWLSRRYEGQANNKTSNLFFGLASFDAEVDQPIFHGVGDVVWEKVECGLMPMIG